MQFRWFASPLAFGGGGDCCSEFDLGGGVTLFQTKTSHFPHPFSDLATV